MLEIFAGIVFVFLLAGGILSVLVFAVDGVGPIAIVRDWLKAHVGHQHDGPPFLTTGTHGLAVSGAIPQPVIVWRTCKKDGLTYTENRLETADEFEARIKTAKPA